MATADATMTVKVELKPEDRQLLEQIAERQTLIIDLLMNRTGTLRRITSIDYDAPAHVPATIRAGVSFEAPPDGTYGIRD